MAYSGEELFECGGLNLNLSKVVVVAVSGSGPNVCGHCLLYVPSRGGYYFHVAGRNETPRYMTEEGYRRYMREEGKREWKRIPIELTNPQAAAALLEELMAQKWSWWVLPHNCVAFVEAILKAGGATWSSYSNCPSIATDYPQTAASQFVREIEGWIYSRTGAPR